MPRILCYSGSLRSASSATALMKALIARMPADVEAEVADIAALPHYDADHDGGEPVARLLAQMRAADGVLFVTPEYNYSIPGVLKNASTGPRARPSSRCFAASPASAFRCPAVRWGACGRSRT